MGFMGQNQGSRCGPFAAANIAEWAGVRSKDPHFRLSRLARDMKTHPKDGTWNGDFFRVLGRNMRRHGYKVRAIADATIRKVMIELARGNALVISSRYADLSDPCDHYFVIIDARPGEFLTINFWATGRKNVKSWIPFQVYEELAKMSFHGPVAKAAVVIPPKVFP